MKSILKYPSEKLSPYVRQYCYFEIGSDEIPFSQVCFPYGSFELICYIENPNLMQWVGKYKKFHEPEIFYAGQVTKPYIMSFEKPCKCLVVSLHPWAGSLLYDIPANKFTNELVKLDCLDKENGLYERLKECITEENIFIIVEKYLIRKLHNKNYDTLAYALACQIMKYPFQETITKEILASGLSRRRMEQRFIESVGLSMNSYLRKTRFQKTVSLLRNNLQDSNLTQIGIDAGYYDQSHFINDFKKFSALSPGEYIKQESRLLEYMETVFNAQE